MKINLWKCWIFYLKILIMRLSVKLLFKIELWVWNHYPNYLIFFPICHNHFTILSISFLHKIPKTKKEEIMWQKNLNRNPPLPPRDKSFPSPFFLIFFSPPDPIHSSQQKKKEEPIKIFHFISMHPHPLHSPQDLCPQTRCQSLPKSSAINTSPRPRLHLPTTIQTSQSSPDLFVFSVTPPCRLPVQVHFQPECNKFYLQSTSKGLILSPPTILNILPIKPTFGMCPSTTSDRVHLQTRAACLAPLSTR